MTRRQLGSAAFLFAAPFVLAGCTLLPPDLEIAGNLDDEEICFVVPYQYQIQTEGGPEPSEFEVINILPGLAVNNTGLVSGNLSEVDTFIASLIAKAPGYNAVEAKTWIVRACDAAPGGIPLPQPPGGGAVDEGGAD